MTTLKKIPGTVTVLETYYAKIENSFIFNP